MFFLQKEFDDRNVFFKKNLTTFQNFGLRPYKPSVAIAVAVGKKPSASAVEIRPSVDHCYRAHTNPKDPMDVRNDSQKGTRFQVVCSSNFLM